jgi:hypothetical protein
MNKSILSLAVACGIAVTGVVHSAEIVPVYADDPNEGYNDTTATAPVGGNPGLTLGEQRRLAAQFAADLWGAILVSDVPILVGANFTPLGPNVLGSAGATQVWSDHPNFPFQGTWYSAALADALAGEDLEPGFTDIGSNFSSDFAFYYGFDNATPAGQVNFLDVVMHEFGHGLGFQNFENEAAGTFLAGVPDVYSQFTFDNTQGLFWPQMTVAQRQASAINYGNVVFTGEHTVDGAALVLDPRSQLRVTAPASVAGTYQFGTAGFGPTPQVDNFSGNVVVGLDGTDAPGPSTTDGCTPFTNAAAVAGNIALVDRGGCAFTVKVLNAQAAGARGVIVANNAPGPAPGLGGGDPAINIPTISLSNVDGAALKAAAGVVAAIEPTGTGLQGADIAGRPRLFMPNPVQSGSSGSHFDTDLLPNALMEPAINDSLNSAYHIDLSANLLRDTGWKLARGNAKLGKCDTGIDVIDDAGMIIGANVIATSNLLAATSPNKGQYLKGMAQYTKRLVDGRLISKKEGVRLLVCAALVRL